MLRKLDRGLLRYCIDVAHGFIVIGSTGFEIYSQKDASLVAKVNSLTSLMNSVCFFMYKNEPRLLLCLNEAETLSGTAHLCLSNLLFSVYSVPQFTHLFTQRLSGPPINHACFSANYEVLIQ